ncbi:unnamed protein product [Phyllotreta striolata]|uniref:UDP-glucuronosyltransferase n=1 Tax=Phyllotreta striolata TaxID=444603 RepID=A0A9N9TV65_PHYSR|nr:unnamed protein product [Phyllotreta striolata]
MIRYTNRQTVNMKSAVILLAASLTLVTGARILCVFQMPAVSHQRVFQPIWKELSLRGHQVVVVTPRPLRDASLATLREIDVSTANYEIIKRHGFQFYMNKMHAVHTKIPKIFAMHYEFAESVLGNKEFIEVYNSTEEKFDLVIAQTYISPVLYGLAAKFKAPLIGVSSMGGYIGTHFGINNPHHPAMYSEMFLPYNGRLSFYERIKSTLYYLFARFYRAFVILPKSDELIRKYLGDDIPHIEEIERNMSLLLLTINPFLYTPRPTIPTIIPLENIHLQPVKPLPAELKSFLDEAKEGVIYFSLGSNVQSVNIPDGVRDTLIAAFAELPYKILWKFESDDLPNKPENVFIKKWLPQNDLLAHPNIKLFISQCGHQSLEETLARGVPIVALPFIADQEMNARRLSELGVAVELDFENLTKEDVKAAVLEVAGNPKYRRNVEKLREIWADHPMKSIDRAVWWIEYVIRHNGTEHLKTPYANIPWFQYLLLDVILVFLSITSIISYSLSTVVKYLSTLTTKKLKTN